MAGHGGPTMPLTTIIWQTTSLVFNGPSSFMCRARTSGITEKCAGLPGCVQLRVRPCVVVLRSPTSHWGCSVAWRCPGHKVTTRCLRPKSHTQLCDGVTYGRRRGWTEPSRADWHRADSAGRPALCLHISVQNLRREWCRPV